MIFVTFHGEQKLQLSYTPGPKMNYPLIILAVLSLVGGFIELPDAWGHFALFSDFIQHTLPPVHLAVESHSTEIIFQLITAIFGLTAIYLTYLFYIKKVHFGLTTYYLRLFKGFIYSGFGFDRLYDKVLVKPIVYFSEINKNDFIDKFFGSIVSILNFLNKQFVKTQDGYIRSYALMIVLGVVIALTLIIFL